MAGFTHTVVTTYKIGSTIFVTASNAYTNNNEINIDEVITDSTSNHQIDVAIDLTDVKSMVLSCDKDVTVYTNDASGGSPDDTIALAAGVPIVWTIGNVESIPLSVDLTALYVTNAGDTDARFKAAFLLDSSP